MNTLNELIDLANRLCENLDKASQNEKKFNTNVCLEFEKLSWETYRMLNDIKSIKEYCA